MKKIRWAYILFSNTRYVYTCDSKNNEVLFELKTHAGTQHENKYITTNSHSRIKLNSHVLYIIYIYIFISSGLYKYLYYSNAELFISDISFTLIFPIISYKNYLQEKFLIV